MRKDGSPEPLGAFFMNPLNTLRRVGVLRMAGIAVSIVLAGLLLAWLATLRPALERIARPVPSSFSSEAVARGSVLASIGSCAVCHTTDRGITFAGGRALATPFGTIYTTNITPDVETGIGGWSREAFRRAMKDGVSRDGHHVYPALPYEHFTHTSDADLDAIYAFLMTRRPVVEATPANRLVPPLGFRPLLEGWKLLFLHEDPFVRDPSRGELWNRGAYLVDGLGHCGGCHTPRNLAGGEERGHLFAGGVAEGWNAPALDATNPRAASWSVDALFGYLRGGLEPGHSVAAGPMGPVAHEMTDLPESDVRAIATYIASSMNPRGAPRALDAPVDRAALAQASQPEGATIFTGACAGCHDPAAPMSREGRPSLSTTSTVLADDPANALQAVLSGVRSPADDETPYMPAFRDSLSDAQAAAVVAYVRARFTNRPAWAGLPSSAAKLRAEASQP